MPQFPLMRRASLFIKSTKGTVSDLVFVPSLVVLQHDRKDTLRLNLLHVSIHNSDAPSVYSAQIRVFE